LSSPAFIWKLTPKSYHQGNGKKGNKFYYTLGVGGIPKEANVGWKMNRWEVGRGVLVKGGSVHGGSLGKRGLSGAMQVAIECVSGNVSSEECGE